MKGTFAVRVSRGLLDSSDSAISDVGVAGLGLLGSGFGFLDFAWGGFVS